MVTRLCIFLSFGLKMASSRDNRSSDENENFLNTSDGDDNQVQRLEA